jgi:hypothetical protein
MISSILIQRRQRRYKPKVGAAAPVALTLVAARYDPVELSVLLTFDRPVNVDAFVPTSVVLYDGPTNHLHYDGATAELAGSTGVSISLAALGGTIHGSVVELIVQAANGIVAVNDGGTWPGTGGIAQPYSG